MSSKPDAFMPFYIADYLGDTMHLTTLQHGAYCLLLFHYWRTQGHLPNDDYQLAAIAKLNYREWAGMRAVIVAFFTVEGECWRHRRADRELEKAKAKYGKRVASSEAAGIAREAKKQAVAPSQVPPEKRVRNLTEEEMDLCIAANGVRYTQGRDVDVAKWRERVAARRAKRKDAA